MLTLRFYTTPAGAAPVQKYIDSLPRQEQAAIAAALRDLRENGIEGSAVTMRQVDGKLWEVKVGAQRVFYVVITGPVLVLLHAYQKQSQRAPKGEVDTARKRMRDVLNG